MPPQVRMWTEIVFNLGYLTVIWSLVAVMTKRRGWPAPADAVTARRFLAAFALLAAGDTGHVGFRAVAYALGDLDRTVSLGGLEVGLVGVGALATAVTVTFFYAALLFVWQARFGKPLGVFGWLLLAVGVARLLFFFHPENHWSSTVPVQPFSTYRNLPLVVQGLGVAFLLLRDAREKHDAAFTRLGVAILLSYAFYAPVILWVQRVPVLGMLMIPKTLAYLWMAWLGFGAFFRRPRA